MRTTAMCFSLLQFPRCRIHTLANSWWDSFSKLGRSSQGSSDNFTVLCANRNEFEGSYSRKWSRRSIFAKTGGKKENLIGKTTLSHEIIPETKGSKSSTYKLGKTAVAKRSQKTIKRGSIPESSTTLDPCKPVTTEIERIQYCRIPQEIAESVQEKQETAENEVSAKLATFFTFDLETTGFSRRTDRIIEFAIQDLRGGENSTFQTFVNPGGPVPNAFVHGISSNMVNKSDVPRMKDLIPILVHYIRSRQIPGGIVVLIAHNARSFDVPFLKSEFSRCSYKIPENWYFLDSLPLARELIKSKGIKLPKGTSLQALREHYDIPLIGSAHRALSDVHTLSLVLQRLTYDLKLPIADLLERKFK